MGKWLPPIITIAYFSNRCLPAYVENGVEFTNEYGDSDERFYDSVELALDEFAKLLRADARNLYPQFWERLADIEDKTKGIGWGFHDCISDVVGDLEDEFGEPQRAGEV